jgi:hypothetical protein
MPQAWNADTASAFCELWRCTTSARDGLPEPHVIKFFPRSHRSTTMTGERNAEG